MYKYGLLKSFIQEKETKTWGGGMQKGGGDWGQEGEEGEEEGKKRKNKDQYLIPVFPWNVVNHQGIIRMPNSLSVTVFIGFKEMGLACQ